MTAEVPKNEPFELRAGDTWKWRREDLADYPASTWTLKYRVANAAASFEITATADGDNFAITVAAATTAAYAAGRYTWQAFVTAGTERYTVDEGTLEVLPDLGALTGVTGYDARSHNRKVLDQILAAIAGLSSDELTTAEYSIGSRTYKRENLAELVKMRSKYEQYVRQEEAEERVRNGYDGGGRIQVRF